MKRITYVLAIVSLLMSSPAASTGEVSDSDRFQLWNGCLPVKLVVEGLNKNAEDIGLTEEAVAIAVRSRLRAARLYEIDGFTFLYVNVAVLGPAYSIDLAYQKFLHDPTSSEAFFAMTWKVGSIGTHGDDSGYILSNVSEHTDHFVDEYLRVNAGACE